MHEYSARLSAVWRMEVVYNPRFLFKINSSGKRTSSPPRFRGFPTPVPKAGAVYKNVKVLQ